MHSSPEDNDDMFPDADTPSTPKLNQTSNLAQQSSAITSAGPELSVTSSMDRSTLNENGKRVAARSEMGNGASKVQVHKQSGYMWEREEDAPGYAWKNKKAQEDFHRSWENIVGKDHMIGSKSLFDVVY
ncbi:hypothetical protein NA57DRAFT_45542 [Rhizodiscina lignyota]|uniref:Uncharacterized protein n=1 Tax=Rhizodiscina lignyota TaxID=1504668 RepID=A0A9P4M2R4_9PEZI|nr:hypothetical protein NA57DRAFT_45542 [Rhizodiscina lignyota]